MRIKPNSAKTLSQPNFCELAAANGAGQTNEPKKLHGVVFQIDTSGQDSIVRYSGETGPGKDIPDTAVVNDHLIISVDGITQDFTEHKRQIRDIFHQSPYGAGLEQPVLGIHEGAGKSKAHDVWRINRDFWDLKALQNGLKPADEILRETKDPSVKAIYDITQEALEQNLKITLVAHSGGGAQTALALNLLAQSGFEKLISDKVRVAALAPAASAEDFHSAGIKPKNLMITGNRRDSVYRLFRHHLSPKTGYRLLSNSIEALLVFGKHYPVTHLPDFIASNNGGALGDFIRGADGGRRELAQKPPDCST